MRGKPGYLVRVGAASWLMEPQADVTAADGVVSAVEEAKGARAQGVW